MATVDFSNVPASKLGLITAAVGQNSVFASRVSRAPIAAGQNMTWLYIDGVEAFDHNSSDSNPKQVTGFNVNRVQLQMTNLYHNSDFDDIDYDTNPELVRGFLGQLPTSFGEKYDRYVFSGKTSGDPTNWVGFTGTATELVDDESLTDAIDELNARGWSRDKLFVFDYSVSGIIRAALKGDGLGSLVDFNLEGDLRINGIPTKFINAGTSINNGEKVVGVLMSTAGFRSALGNLSIKTIDTEDGLANIVRVKARQIAGFTGIQDAAIPFKVTASSN